MSPQVKYPFKDINRCMAYNFLQLKNSKSEIIMFSPPTTITSPISLGPLSSNIKPTARNVGVMLDSDFTFIPHINKVVQPFFNIFYHNPTLKR